ncbi:MAG: hypothetical protein IH958_04480 [Chloroflexi bacterium]|nr:hypothetical protein [Chloroflexota bacterium]
MDRRSSWLQQAVTTAALIIRQAALSLRNNWGIGLLSIALAVSLWVFVTDEDDSEQTGRVPGTVPVEAVNLPPGQAVFSISPEVVTVRARAAENVFEGLAAEDFQATVDLSNVTAQQATVSVHVTSEESRARVVDVSPSQVTVTLENVVSRTVPVVVQELGGLPRGFQLGAVEADVTDAVVTGPERLVADVATVQADVNLTGARTDFEQRVALEARGEGRTPFQGVIVEPANTIVRVTVIQLEFSRAFVVQPSVSGSPADGYNVVGIDWDPVVVVVTGPLEILQTIDAVAGIETDAVPIEGANADVIGTPRLRLPQGVTADLTQVTVRVSIEAAQGQVSFSVVPDVINLASGLVASVTPATVSVVLEGSIPVLRAIDVGDIFAELDLGGLGPGEQPVAVRVVPPTGTTLTAPVVVRVTISSR